MKLSSFDRQKSDISDDEIFYRQPRYVNHLSLSFRNRLTKLYSQYLKKQFIVLDLMSSWVSHLPANINYKKIIGHGLNELELKANKRLDQYWVQNLNKNQNIPLDTSYIDAGLIVAGWQYLQYPERISVELSRIIKPKAILIISFTNRAFWTKSPNIWSNSTDDGRVAYVKSVLLNNGWEIEKIYVEETFDNKLLGFYTQMGDPFFSIVAKNNKSNN